MNHGSLILHVPSEEDRQAFGDRVEWRLFATPDVMIRLKRVFPRARASRSPYVRLVHTPEVARDLEWALLRWPLEMSMTDARFLARAAAEHEAREVTVQQILAGGQLHFDLMEPARPARDYQLVAAELAIANRSLLLADDLGLGKSMSAILTLRDPASLPALIVCPTHLPRQWQRELELTLPGLRSHVIRTGKVYDPAMGLERLEPDVLICNYHKLRGWVDHLAGRMRTVIFDEAQELRRALSEKYDAAARIADAADLRIGLTATPVYNYAGEIHNIMAVLAPDALGSRDEFAQQWGSGYSWQVNMRVADPQALGTFLRTSGLMLRRTRKDVGRELPEVVRVPHTVDADADVHEGLMEGALDLANVILTGTPREAFVASGDLDWRVRHATGVSKAPYVAEFVRMVLETERKVVLFGWHRDVYDIWLERLAEFNPVLYTGSESAKQKDAAKDNFLLEDGDDPSAGECRVFIMSLRSGSGLDGLQTATSVCVFGELDWSPGMHDQCIGRLHRDGQDGSVIAYFLVSDMGSDPVIADVLNVKRSQSEPLRDPDAELFETADTSDRVRKLAESVLAARRTSRVTA